MLRDNNRANNNFSKTGKPEEQLSCYQTCSLVRRKRLSIQYQNTRKNSQGLQEQDSFLQARLSLDNRSSGTCFSSVLC